jgi:formate dehydrogenase subunit gamma
MTVDDIIERHREREGPLLEILADVQAELGCIDEESVRRIAATLNLSRAEVHGIVSFYHDFRPERDDRPVIRLCRAEACQAQGVEGWAESLIEAAGARVRVETVYCLGLCSAGPAAMAGGRPVARLDRDSAMALLGQL